LKFVIVKILISDRPPIRLTVTIKSNPFAPHNTTYNKTVNIKNLSAGLMLLGLNLI